MTTETEEIKTQEQNGLAKPPRVDEIVEGTVVGKGKSSVFLNLGNWGTGIIYGKEYNDARDKLKALDNGDSIFAKIVDLENEEGYIELSLTKAGQELAWKTLLLKRENDETLMIKITGANKGGLLADVSGIPAFLPVSQLSAENYPKVEGGDNQKILKALQLFVGKELEVKIFDLDQKEEKLILSEKAKESGKIKEMLANYKEGDTVEGEITGVVEFGAFIKFGKEGLEGLIHISELDWQLIEDPTQVISVGDKVKAKIIDIANDKISLSIKALKSDPWKDIEKEFKKGDKIKGEVTKFNSFGCFIQVQPKVQGLCHISEFGSQKKMEEVLKIGDKKEFEIISIEPKEHRMSLKLIDNPAKI